MHKVLAKIKSKYNSKFVLDSFSTLFIGLLISFLSYLFNVLAAHRLPEESFGILSAVIGLIYIIQVPTMTIQTELTKSVAKANQWDLKKIKSHAYRFFLILGLVLSLSTIIFSKQISVIVKIAPQYVSLISIMILGSLLIPVGRGILLGMHKINTVNILNLLEASLKLILFLVALSLFDTTASYPIIAFGLPTLIVSIVFIFFIRVKEDNKKKSNFKLNYKALVSTFLAFLLFNLPFSYDIVLTAPSLRPGYAALALMSKIVYFGGILIIPVSVAYIAKEKKRDIQIKYLLGTIGIVFSLTAFITLVYYFAGDWLVPIVSGDKYLYVAPYTWIMGVGIVIYSLATVIINFLIVENRFFYIPVLLGIFVLQYVLYKNFNSEISLVVRNQIIVFSLLFATSLISLLYHLATYSAKNIKAV
ncbi:hypothetical protein H6764_00375 [Candidatus Nomurabacteria bacterium]|nr:hypothetical protein [Candidatus Nomurabacteria bacterium]